MSSVAASKPRLSSLSRLIGADLRATFGMLVVLVVTVAALFAPFLTPYGSAQADFASVLSAPSLAHPFGTDDLGRDILTRCLYGARVSLIVGTISVFSALISGSILGSAAGYAGKWLDMLIMRLMDVIFAFPSVLLALAVTAALGPSLTNAILAIAIVNLPIFARLARAQTLVVRGMEYVEAKQALGFGPVSILFWTILPNIAAPIIVQGSLLFAQAIITESYLSFLGLGAQPPTATWGAMLRNAISFLSNAPWMAWFPGLAIFLAVLGFNLLGDALRDLLDPRDG